MRILELFCGMGGCHAALGGSVAAGRVRVVGALDQSVAALETYRLNFPGTPAIHRNLEHSTADELAAFEADLWWLSPPCQPYTIQGARRDLDDPRASSFRKLLEHLPRVRPRYVALENVEGFATSRARARLLETLSGYAVRERLLCPTELGVPNRRPRYYLVAARDGEGSLARAPELPATQAPESNPPAPAPRRRLADVIDPAAHAMPGLRIDPAVARKYREAIRVLPAGSEGPTACFTSGYGRALARSGSYLQVPVQAGEPAIRRFSPEEVTRLLGFPPSFAFPPGMPLTKRWQLAGNSLSVDAVAAVLRGSVLGI